MTALLLLGVPTPGSEHTALMSSRTSRRQHCDAADKAPTMSSPSLSRTSKNTSTLPLGCGSETALNLIDTYGCGGVHQHNLQVSSHTPCRTAQLPLVPEVYLA
jgi:hypothetical protein